MTLQKNIMQDWVPELLDQKKSKDARRIDALIAGGTCYVLDVFDDLLTELKKTNRINGVREKDISNPQGKWIYYSWRNTVTHILDEMDYNWLRSSRNFPLISKAEQASFKNIKVGFAGLSVGNPGAVCIALEGGANYMKLADNDVLELSNLNRFRGSVTELGLNKAVITARQIYEVNPFAQIDLYNNGITDDNVDNFFTNPQIDILVEETDDLKLKIRMREKAKELKVPVLMVTGNGANVIIDVERYDIVQELKIMNGTISETLQRAIGAANKVEDAKEYVRLCRDFIGVDKLTGRQKEAFDLFGNNTFWIPQLSESSFMRGAVISYFIRMMASGYDVPTGRYYLWLDQVIQHS